MGSGYGCNISDSELQGMMLLILTDYAIGVTLAYGILLYMVYVISIV